jgi:hypothetical protein
LTQNVRLSKLNSLPSSACLSLENGGITDMNHHTWPQIIFEGYLTHVYYFLMQTIYFDEYLLFPMEFSFLKENCEEVCHVLPVALCIFK